MNESIVERFIVHQLLRLARGSDGDFDSLIIASLLNLQAQLASDGGSAELPGLVPDSLLPASLLRAAGLRSSEIAQLTGIPRETVRRKLERLQAKGRVQRHDSGRWYSVGATPPGWREILRETAQNIEATASALGQLPQG